jgi:hypothetical protein
MGNILDYGVTQPGCGWAPPRLRTDFTEGDGPRRMEERQPRPRLSTGEAQHNDAPEYDDDTADLANLILSV